MGNGSLGCILRFLHPLLQSPHGEVRLVARKFWFSLLLSLLQLNEVFKSPLPDLGITPKGPHSALPPPPPPDSLQSVACA